MQIQTQLITHITECHWFNSMAVISEFRGQCAIITPLIIEEWTALIITQ